MRSFGSIAAVLLAATGCSRDVPPAPEERTLVVTFTGDGSGTVGATGLSCVAARCPLCGGRAMWRSTSPVKYECLDCGRRHDASIV